MAKAKTSKQIKAKKKPAKLAGKGVHWTKEEVTTLMAFVEKGMSLAEIAQNLGRPPKSVENKIYRERKNASKTLRKNHKKKTVKDTSVLKVSDSNVKILEAFKEPDETAVPPNKFKAFFRWLLGIGK